MVLRRFLRICAADLFRCSTCLVVASVGAPANHLLLLCTWTGWMDAAVVNAVSSLDMRSTL